LGVRVDDALNGVLECLSDSQVEALAATVEGSSGPSTALGKVVVGGAPGAFDAVKKLRDAWEASPALTGPGLALALRAALAARQAAYARRGRPVWTGPGAVGEQRLTAGVLHELLAGARERILLVSYAAYTLAEIARDLEAAVGQGCRVDVVFETTEDSDGQYSGAHDQPFGTVAGIHRWRWPAEQRTGGAVLHAKLLVIDGARAFVGSANLTARALAHNLEVGVLIQDTSLASELDSHVRALMTSGVLVESDAQ
jgi:putative cardiolipin synthase